MKKLLVILLCCTMLSLSAQTSYPSGGVFVQCDFNKSIKDSKGMLTFINMPDSVRTFVPGADETANSALRFGYGGDRGLTKLKEPFAAIPQSSLVITLKINKLLNEKDHSIFFSSLREVVVNGEGKLRTKVQRSKKSDKKDVFDFDLGIKPGEWVTIVAMWDNKTEKVTYWANGKYCEVNNVRLSEYIPNDQYSQSVSLMGYCEGDVDEFMLYNRHLTETEIQALCGTGQPFE